MEANKTTHDVKALTSNSLVMILFLLFPILTVLQGFSSLTTNLNKVAVVFIVITISLSIFFGTLTRAKCVFLFAVIIITTIMIALDQGLGDLSYLRLGEALTNTYTYFPVWCIFFLFIKDNFETFVGYLQRNISFVHFVCLTWNIITVLSLFNPGCYTVKWGEGRYFSSFAVGEHKFASTCTFILALSWVLVLLTNRKRYYCYAVMPLVGIFICGTRTYLGVAFIVVAIMYYQLFKRKYLFYLSILPLLLILVVIVFLSPIGSKMILTLRGEGYGGFWFVFTSSRNVIWALDLDSFSRQSIINQIFGTGGTFVYRTNLENGYAAVWAHNDFIQVLLTNGVVGLLCYIGSIAAFARKRIRQQAAKGGIPWFASIGFFMIWIFNAFFNGVYVYPCAMFSLPLFFYAIFYQNSIMEALSLNCSIPTQQVEREVTLQI